MVSKAAADRKMKSLAERLNTEVKYSKAGVPIIVKTGSTGITYSICYFRTTDTYKVFWPYPSYNAVQKTRSFTEIELIHKLKLPLRLNDINYPVTITLTNGTVVKNRQAISNY